MAWLLARSFGFDLVGGKGWQHHLWMRHSKHSWRSKRAEGGDSFHSPGSVASPLPDTGPCAEL